MEAQTERHGKFTIIRTGRDATMCEDAGRVRELLCGLAENNVKHICVDLSRAAVIDSSVIGALVEFHVKLSRQGGELVVLNARDLVLESLFRTQMHQVVRFVQHEKQL